MPKPRKPEIVVAKEPIYPHYYHEILINGYRYSVSITRSTIYVMCQAFGWALFSWEDGERMKVVARGWLLEGDMEKAAIEALALHKITVLPVDRRVISF